MVKRKRVLIEVGDPGPETKLRQRDRTTGQFLPGKLGKRKTHPRIGGAAPRKKKRKVEPKPPRVHRAPRERGMATRDKYSQYFSFVLPAAPAAAERWGWGEIEIPRTPDIYRSQATRQTILEMDKIEWEFESFPKMHEYAESELDAAWRHLDIAWGLFYRPIVDANDLDNCLTYTNPNTFWLHKREYQQAPSWIYVKGTGEENREQYMPKHVQMMDTINTDAWQDNRGYGRLWPLERLFYGYRYRNSFGDVMHGFSADATMEVEARIWYRFTSISLPEWLGMTAQMTLGTIS